MHEFYVYIFLDPRKPGKYCYPDLNMSFLYEPLYVGKGIKKRYDVHFKKSSQTYNMFKVNKIKNIIEAGLSVIVVFPVVNITEYSSLLAETYFIRSIGRFDLKAGPLTNRNDGGIECNGFSVERRKNISQANKGKIVPQEVRDKISNTMRGMKRPPEYVKMLSDNRKGKENPGARVYLFTDPLNNMYRCDDGFKHFIDSHNLEYSVMRGVLKYKKSVKKKSSRCYGWNVVYADLLP